MVFTKNLAALAAGFASIASAAPLASSQVSKRAGGGGNGLAVYYGNSAATKADGFQNACKDPSVDIIILTFATSIQGDKITVLHGGPTDQELSSQIKACQAGGKKVFMSIGGATGTVTWSSADQAKQGADAVYKQFLTSGGMYGTALDGIDLDIEDAHPAFWTDFTQELASKKSSSQMISGAPQCPSPDASLPFDVLNMMDLVWVQFYNNKPCELGSSGFQASVKDWASKLTKPKLYVGAPASSSAAGSGYLPAAQMATALESVKDSISGAMLWDYDSAVANGNYQQAVKKAMGGSTGGSSPSSPPAAASSSSTPAASKPSKPAGGNSPTTPAATPVPTQTKHDQGGPTHTVHATKTAHVTHTTFIPTGTSAPVPVGTGSSGPSNSTSGPNTQTCSSAGAILCSADGSEFGICDGANAVMMAVSQGTVCQGGNIVAADSGASSPSASSDAPATSGAAGSGDDSADSTGDDQ